MLKEINIYGAGGIAREIIKIMIGVKIIKYTSTKNLFRILILVDLHLLLQYQEKREII